VISGFSNPGDFRVTPLLCEKNNAFWFEECMTGLFSGALSVDASFFTTNLWCASAVLVFFWGWP